MNKKRVICLVSVLVMAFAMSACNSNDDGGGTRPYTLSGDVYNNDGSVYTGTKDALTSSAGGSGTIRGGKLSFSIGVPGNQKSMIRLLSDLDARFGFNVFSYAGWNPSDTQATDLKFSNRTKKLEVTAGASKTRQEIIYIYVDRNCTVSADGGNTATYAGVTATVSKFTLNFKQGWNALSILLTANGTLIIGIGDSNNCKWVYE